MIAREELILSNILVIGAAGFVGSHFVEECLSRGDHVMVMDDFSTGKREYIPEEIKCLKYDITIPEDVRWMINLKDWDYVVNFAVLPLTMAVKLGNVDRIHEVNCNGVINILESLRKYNFEYNHDCTYIHISSSEVFGTLQYQPMDEKHPMLPTTTYGASKAAAEMYCRSYSLCYGLPIKIIRPFNMFGERMRMDTYANVIYAWMMNSLHCPPKPMVIHGSGKQTRDFNYVKDITNGIYNAMIQLPIGEDVNIGSGIETSINKLADMVGRVTGNSWRHYEKRRIGDVDRHCCDARKMISLCDWEPQYELEEGLRRTWKWIKGVE